MPTPLDRVPHIITYGPTITEPPTSTQPVIFAGFNVDIDETQIDNNVNLGQKVYLLGQNDSALTPLQFLAYAKRILTFQPSGALIPGETYEITVRGSLSDTSGRSPGVDFRWAFTVPPGLVGGVSLLSPADSTATGQLPPLAWTASTVSGALSGDLLQYRVDLDVEPLFGSIGPRGWTTLTTQTSAAIGTMLPAQMTYYWRVTPQVTDGSGNVTYGPVTPVQSFFLGTFAQVSPTTQVLYRPATFDVQSSNWPNAMTNLSDYPDLTINFYTPLDPSSVSNVTVSMVSQPVDGYNPLLDAVLSPTVTVASGGLSLTIVPDVPIQPNTRYTITLQGLRDITGVHLPQVWTGYFTGRYTPLYLGNIVIRASFGHLVQSVTDDFINFHIYRASLDANRHWLRNYSPLIYGGPPESYVRGVVPPAAYSMERWVEYEASARVLQEVYLDQLTVAGKTRKLGDYEESDDAQDLVPLQTEILRLRKLAMTWLSEFSWKRARPRVARKSETFLRGYEAWDRSELGRSRSSF